MPRSTDSAKVRAAKTCGNSLRVKINKLLGECTEQVSIILELTGQNSENTETEEEIDECQEELKSLFDQVMSYKDEHTEVCFELSQMLHFIAETQEILGETKLMQEAKQLLKKTDEEVKKWKRENHKWLRKKKKFVQTGQRVREEVNKESTDFALIKLMEKLSDGLKPDMLLSDNGHYQTRA